jgi:L-2-hydroxyglutarate oxidase LhgO
MPEFAAAVVGAGVVGLAAAQRLQAAGRPVVLLEAAPREATATSARNSGVLHAGLFYPAGSLKLALCLRGNALARAWCAAHEVPVLACGKWLVAADAGGAAALEVIRARAAAHGVPGLAPLAARDLAAQPELRVAAGLSVGSSAVVDAGAFCASLLAAFRAQGGTFAPRHRVTGAAPIAGGYALDVRLPDGSPGRVTAAAVVNAAGLAADEVAALPGLDVAALGYRQHYWKGNLFQAPGFRGRFTRLVYPIPPQDAPHLGAHVVIGLDGTLRLGPDAERLTERTLDYRVDPARAAAILREAQTYWPGLRLADLAPDYAGIRPKLAADGTFRDFIVAEESARGLPGWVNLAGIESPGLTAALAIAERVEGHL